MSEKKELVAARQKKEKEMLLEQLRRIPIVQVACEKAGVSRATFYRLRSEDTDFGAAAEEAIAEGVAFINDMSETQVIALIRERNWPSIAFWLKHHHPQYANKMEVTAKVELPKELTPEQEAEIERAVKLASLVEGANGESRHVHE